MIIKRYKISVKVERTEIPSNEPAEPYVEARALFDCLPEYKDIAVKQALSGIIEQWGKPPSQGAHMT